MSHCNQGENLHRCKYGQNDICPAMHHANAFKDPHDFIEDSSAALAIRAAGALGAKFDMEAVENLLDSGISLQALRVKVKARTQYLRDFNSPEAARRLGLLPWDELGYEMAAVCNGLVPVEEN